MSFAARLSALDQRLQTTLIIAIYTGFAYAIFHTYSSADLNALFLAALNYGTGNTGAVYADVDKVFQLAVPAEWQAQADALGITTQPLFPYIYPPIWAAVFAPLASAAGAELFTNAAYVVNPALIGLSAVLAHRIMRPAMKLPVWLLLCLALVTTTTFGYVALFQNQPQIVVSFLILLALERDRSGAPKTAGIMLALAASLKLYPALFALFWLAACNYRPLCAFLIAGAGLGGLSLALTGWPLHAEFLNQIRVIAHSLVSCGICYSIDATLAQWVHADFLRNTIGIQDPNADAVVNVIVSVKPAILRMTDQLIMLAGLALLFLAIRRADAQTRFRRLYPVGIIFVALASPLTWSYHYLSVAFFFPILTETLRRGWAIFIGIALLYNGGLLWLVERLPTPFFAGQLAGTLGMIAILAAFLSQTRETARGAVRP